VIPRGYQGVVGRFTYDYRKIYLFEFNAGYNGNENFAPGKRFGFFPAYSLGWVPSEEKFFPKNNIISFVKFRGTYGEVGNDLIGGNRFLYMPSPYTYYGTGNNVSAYYWGEAASTIAMYRGILEGKIGNPDVTWERAKKSNVGIELSLFKDKISITADYFQEKRDNILMNPNSIPSTSGMGNNATSANIGKMDNTGFDGEIGYNNNISKFEYWIKANMTYARNTVVFRDEIPDPNAYLRKTGHPFAQPFGFVAEGLYNTWEEVNHAYRPFYGYQGNFVQPGVVQYVDINGDGKVDHFDMAPIGYPFFPEINYGLSLGGQYKGFDFSVLFHGATRVTFMGQSFHIKGWDSWHATYEYLKNSWSLDRYEQGLPIHFPHLNIGGETSAANVLNSSYFAEDASYVRLKNAEIGYRISGVDFMKKLGMQSARIYVNGSNLWSWARFTKRYPGIDPEDRPMINLENEGERSVYPRISVINMGLNVNF
jgi:TonB-linked SusC/RagA family outer membrane protein